MTKNLMCIVPANLRELQVKGVARHILQRDLGGYWDTVLTVHPFGKEASMTILSDRHCVLEYEWTGLRNLASMIPSLVKQVRRYQITAIKAHDPYACGVLAYIVSKCCKLPHAVGIYSSYELTSNTGGKPLLWHRKLDRAIARFTLGHADMVLGGSRDATAFALRNNARPDRTFTVRTGGVHELHFSPLSTRRNIKLDCGWLHKKIVLYVGRLTDVKFPEDAIEAFKGIRQVIPDSVLVIAGDGELRSALEKKARGLNVRFVGFQPQHKLANLMFSADVILAPLSGSALVESALSGTPIVAYDVDWHSELIKDSENGILVPFRDTRAMGAAATALLLDRGRAIALGVAGRETAIKQHSLEKLYQEEASCFDWMLGRTGR